MGKTFIISNQKGGVLKTTSTRNIGAGLAMKGYKVLEIDFDAQGSLTTSFGLEPSKIKNSIANLIHAYINRNPIEEIADFIIEKDGVHLIPANTSLAVAEQILNTATSREYILKKIIDRLKNNYDYILVDCSPNLGLLNINALTACDKILIPIKAQHLDYIGFTLLFDSIKLVQEETNPKLEIGGYFLTMYDSRLKLARAVEHDVQQTCELILFEERLKKQNINKTFDFELYDSVENYYDTLQNEYGGVITEILQRIRNNPIRMFNTKISVSTKSAEASKYGQSIFEYAPECKVAEEYKMLIQEVLENER